MILRLILLVSGVFACSTAVIFIKASNVHTALLAAFRLLVAVCLLLPLYLRDVARNRPELVRYGIRRAIIPGIVLGLHFITWIAGARLTLAANASLIVNMVPVVMPFLLFLLSRELINRWEVLGTVLAVSGVVFLVRADLKWDPQYFRGDMLCVVSMLLFAVYLALARGTKTGSSLWLYVVPLYFSGGVFCLLAGGPMCRLFGMPSPSFAALCDPDEMLMILALAAIPTIWGHSVLNYCMKKMRGQMVAIVNLGQFVFAGIMAFFLLMEVPATAFYISCVPLVSGAAVAIWFTPSDDVTERKDPG